MNHAFILGTPVLILATSMQVGFWEYISTVVPNWLTNQRRVMINRHSIQRQVVTDCCCDSPLYGKEGDKEGRKGVRKGRT
jgi:hypothetical protein